jgi:hypothetical protein
LRKRWMGLWSSTLQVGIVLSFSATKRVGLEMDRLALVPS